MRSALFIATTLLAAASAFAEEPAVRSRSEDVNGKPDMNKTFNMQTTSPFRHSPGTFQSSKSAASKEFYFEQKVTPKGYNARAFSGTKSAWMGDFKFSTKAAAAQGRYEIPNAAKPAAVKTAPTKEAREVGKTAATRELPQANRPYLGKEAEKMRTPIDMNNQPRWTNDLRELKTIEDVKALLNKN